MNILLIGSGGREHALAWRLAASPSCDTLFAAPGNPGIARHTRIADIDVSDHAAVKQFCVDQAIDMVVVGPEGPLVAGIADALGDVPVFGPSAAAARLEGSKGFVKDLCSANAIPTAAYARHTNRADALAALAGFGLPVVIKADGLAAGKGVIIAETGDEARAAIDHMFDGGFGAAGAEVVIEEFMTGEEASFFALTDGTTTIPFGSAQDHKRVGDGDTGPNTGGMGAYSPASIVTPDVEAQVMRTIILPTVEAMRAAGTPYVGVLYAGLMLTSDGPKLIEYNCRFGDPECQVLMMRHTGDLAALMLAVATGRLAAAPPSDYGFCDDCAVTIVIAARGYPDKPASGGLIALPDLETARIFQAGTAEVNGRLTASGGRVLNVTARGPTVRAAHDLAYAAAKRVDFADGFYRSDIGWRELARESGGGTGT